MYRLSSPSLNFTFLKSHMLIKALCRQHLCKTDSAGIWRLFRCLPELYSSANTEQPSLRWSSCYQFTNNLFNWLPAIFDLSQLQYLLRQLLSINRPSRASRFAPESLLCFWVLFRASWHTRDTDISWAWLGQRRHQRMAILKEVGDWVKLSYSSWMRGYKEKRTFSCFFPTLLVWHNSIEQNKTIDMYRLFSHCPGCHFTVLHAFTSSNMFLSLQHIMSPRRSRWIRSKKIQSINNVWSCAGHGDGSLHDFMSACVSSISFSKMEYHFPGFDQSWSCKPLHSYVCNIDHGRKWSES